MKRMLVIMIAAALLLSSCGGGRAEIKTSWQAGYAERELTVDISKKTYYVAGYQNDHPATGVLDNQKVKAVYVAAGEEELVLVSVDCVGLTSFDADAIKNKLPKALRDAVHVASTHTHAGVDTMGLWGPIAVDGKDADFMSDLYEKAAEAAIEAYENRREGRLFYGSSTQGIEDLQRDSREPCVYDRAVYQLRFEPFDGGRGIRIINYAAHAESLRSDNSLISADFPRYLCDALTRESGDDCVFFPAAIGGLIMTKRLADAKGKEYPVTENVVRTGELIASAALAINNERELAPELESSTSTFTIPLENQVFVGMRALGILTNKLAYRGEGPYGLSVETSVSLLRFGDLAAVGVPGELFPELAYGDGKATGVSRTIREILGEEFLVFGLFDDEIGYIVPPSDFLVHESEPYISTVEDATGENHYEETNSVGPDAAERILSALLDPAER